MKNTEDRSETDLHLEGIPKADLKRNAFSVPEGYFKNLTPRVMESVRGSEVAPSRPSFQWNTFLMPSFGVAALVLVAWFFLKPTDPAAPDLQMVLASLSVEELAEYADLQPSELISYDLVNYEQAEMPTDDLSEQDILEYLDAEEETELTTIANEIEL